MADELTDREKLQKILEALNMPESQYAIQGDAARVIAGTQSETDHMMLAVSTALWFMFYESTEGGLIWGLWVPEPNDPEELCDAPIIYVSLLDIEIRCTFGAGTPDHTCATEIAKAKIVDGWPIAFGDAIAIGV